MNDYSSLGNHYMQTEAWAAVKGTTGFEVREVLLDLKAGKTKAFLYVRNVTGLGKLAYGPMWPNTFAEEELKNVAGYLKEIAADCFLVRLEPAVSTEKLNADKLEAAGFVLTGRHVQYLSTLIVDLEQTEAEVLASLHKTARYDIKMAREKFGVVCKKLPVNGKTIAQLSDIIFATQGRKNFYLRSREFLQNYWRAASEKGEAAIYAAEHEGKVIAMSFVVVNGDKAFYKDAGSLPNSTGAASALQWFVLQDLMKQGVKSYDLSGALANGKEAESDPLWGVYKFKKKFSKDLVTYPGFIDLPIRPRAYKLWRKNERLITKAVRKLTGDLFY